MLEWTNIYPAGSGLGVRLAGGLGTQPASGLRVGLLGGSGRRPASGVGAGPGVGAGAGTAGGAGAGNGGGAGAGTGVGAGVATGSGAGTGPAAIKKHTYRELEDLVNRLDKRVGDWVQTNWQCLPAMQVWAER